MKLIKYELITNKQIQKFMEKQMKYWIPVTYNKKKYIMTFQFNVYEVN